MDECCVWFFVTTKVHVLSVGPGGSARVILSSAFVPDSGGAQRWTTGSGDLRGSFTLSLRMTKSCRHRPLPVTVLCWFPSFGFSVVFFG